MTKYYRVKQDNFLWCEGAILQSTDGSGYTPTSDIWDTTEHNGSEYISSRIIENCPEWFERVYEVNFLTKTVYETKKKAQELMKKHFDTTDIESN